MAATISTSHGADHASILGIGGYRPSRVVSNAEICESIDSSDEWIRTRSGIIERRWALPHETVLFMSAGAARKAIERAGIQPQQLDCVIVATVTHLMQTPAVATLLSEELGATPAAAFDISAACAGFCHGVSLASDMVRSGTAKHVLAIGVERLSDITDRHDRSTAFIFADGAGAAVIGPSQTEGIGPVAWGADGSKYDLIRQKESWTDVLAMDVPAMPNLRMDGNPVFRWASFEMAKVAREALTRAGVSVDDLDVFIPHQANMRIVDAMARTLKLPERVAIARDIAHQGNTSAASIPLAAEAMLESGEAKSGDLALMIAFGAGLAYAGQVVRLP
ncbi:MAG: 3-oxoacyl-[acyl-carrier-protein] synthase [Nocardioidaceae bacterium]|jgi:3-oxoacyl-[acyl-carrier-protein] synthase-3|nr:3-oxoacyl-[acyl-carrier-protein] synthase [Nocardioidaceae bacterium]